MVEQGEVVAAVTAQDHHPTAAVIHLRLHVVVAIHRPGAEITPRAGTIVTVPPAENHILHMTVHLVMSPAVVTHRHAEVVEGLRPLRMMDTGAHILMTHIQQRVVLMTISPHHRMLTVAAVGARRKKTSFQ